MRVSRAKAAENRERIIDVAAKLFRERGFDGIGVDELMKSVGLTHGGFYGNFASKEDLMVQACARALEGSLDTLQKAVDRGGESALSVVASTYLSPAHRDRPGEGCALAALGGEAARHDSRVRGAFTKNVHSVVDLLTRLVPSKSKRAKRERALAIYATMVGAMVLARAIDDADLSEEMLQSALASITRPASHRHTG
jgi:TetR/AcrR family transcriptional regulator, transcriptional repressor for nem operon